MLTNPLYLLYLLLFILLLSIALSLHAGTVSVGFSFWLEGWHTKQQAMQQAWYIVQYIRLPRIVLALMVGGGLAMGGVVMQSLFRNALVEPSLVGVSSGSAFMAVVAMFIGQLGWLPYYTLLGAYWLPTFAFVGGIMATWIAQKIATQKGQIATNKLLLAGIAINSLAGAGIGFMLFLAEDTTLRNFSFWSLGSLANITWEKNYIILVIYLIALLFFIRQNLALDALILGEREAFFVGIATEKLKKRLILVNTLLISTLIAFVGMIGFVGLVVPHILRLCGIRKHKYLLPFSAIAGAILLLWADMLARTMFSPSELPIGILTAFLGTPFFIWLLFSLRAEE